jgi:hypothetical protein
MIDNYHEDLLSKGRPTIISTRLYDEGARRKEDGDPKSPHLL